MSEHVLEVRRAVYLKCRLCGMRTQSLDEEHTNQKVLEKVRKLIEEEHMKREHSDANS